MGAGGGAGVWSFRDWGCDALCFSDRVWNPGRATHSEESTGGAEVESGGGPRRLAIESTLPEAEIERVRGCGEMGGKGGDGWGGGVLAMNLSLGLFLAVRSRMVVHIGVTLGVGLPREPMFSLHVSRLL